MTRNAVMLLTACEIDYYPPMSVGFETGAVLIKVPMI